ncbi:MAG TPA: deoxyribodipyrimidine photolyase, partial [bacterium]|nr:deoxyribodipyrimidine photolyase [bacterium]
VALRPTPLRRSGLAWGDAPDSPLPSLPERLRRQADLTDRPRGGESAARKRFDAFLARGLPRYLESGRFLDGGLTSGMSPYLHFGQVSPLTLALKVAAATGAPAAAREAFLEELLVRRELAFNFVRRTDDYDEYGSLPAWARTTLASHRRDPRPETYSPDELEAARTADPYWNAAMIELRRTGTLHNRLRMYWGKRILEWIPDPARAYRTTLELNNRWFLDGRDPNSYANVGWIYGLHDHPWPERPVFGSVRSMTAGGLERKADPGAYVERIRSLFGDRVPREPPGIA